MSFGSVLLIVAIVEIATLYRADWVSNKRQFVADCHGNDAFNRLPPFLIMVLTFWVWDVNTFLGEGDL
ncbi:hypothetical protein [Enterobacter asburiae]|uniref:hypothetical protein n=1 Tax=Enterobacter asburiae TaxID=61645 RepID=UPI003BE75291